MDLGWNSRLDLAWFSAVRMDENSIEGFLNIERLGNTNPDYLDCITRCAERKGSNSEYADKY